MVVVFVMFALVMGPPGRLLGQVVVVMVVSQFLDVGFLG